MIQIAGKLQALGQLAPEDIPSKNAPCAVLNLADGRLVTVIGLTTAECRSLAPTWGEPVLIDIRGVAP